jgi:hypothetical protein
VGVVPLKRRRGRPTLEEAAAWAAAAAAAAAATGVAVKLPTRRSSRLAEAGENRSAGDYRVGEGGCKRKEPAALAAGVAAEAAENAPAAQVVLAAAGPRNRGRPRKDVARTGAAVAAAVAAAGAAVAAATGLRRSGRFNVKTAAGAVEEGEAGDAAAAAAGGRMRGRRAAGADLGGRSSGGYTLVDRGAQVRTALAAAGAAVLA